MGELVEPLGPVELPPAVLALLASDTPAAHLGKIVFLTTVDEDGFPHLAAFSLGELTAPEPGLIRLLVAEDGRTLRNLRARPAVTLVVVDADLCCYVKGRAEALDRVVAPSALLPFSTRLVAVTVTDAKLDREAGARIVSGPRYEREGSAAQELAHWLALREVLKT